MLVASVLSLKGGVGKTTVTLGLASAAIHAGLNTLLVDLDPQMNATTTVEIDDGGTNIADVLANPRRAIVNETVRVSPWSPHLRVLAGSEDTEAHNNPDPTAKQLARLTTALSKVDPVPDLILIDCPPSLGQLTRSALVASDRAVLVTEPSLYAVTGVQRALEAVQKERLTHRHLQPLGVVVNRVRPRMTEHDYRLAELKDLFGPLVLNPQLPDRAAIQQAQGAAVPIHQWPTAGAREMAVMFDALLDRLMRSAKHKSRA
ncbi:Cellulose biosynthesis protein BcsQ [Nakamurella panacisegetis]|uniref:Cellulose biosynthesis protein BcsQ n=1 Tax=Nakamurella panacisegetis TaxID=1090615 RepID=A0A1H0Q6W8_9ACTN|nr:ParA family protein [Nakamurella panacisegetis]SDP13084.1 Cellulose biosynthesis protein BcsQ [Nakamurella panacisegetis]